MGNCSTKPADNTKSNNSFIKQSVIPDNLEFKDCPIFIPPIKEGRVIKVYDGDTIKVVFPIFNTPYKWNCRVNGVDTPELRTRDESEKKNGYYVRDRLREKILNKMVKVKCGEFDKYGRLLADIYIDKLHVNKWLIDRKYAFAYDGGTKKSWKDAPYID